MKLLKLCCSGLWYTSINVMKVKCQNGDDVLLFQVRPGAAAWLDPAASCCRLEMLELTFSLNRILNMHSAATLPALFMFSVCALLPVGVSLMLEPMQSLKILCIDRLNRGNVMLPAPGGNGAAVKRKKDFSWILFRFIDIKCCSK